MTNSSKPSVLVIDQYDQAALTIRVYGDTALPGWSTVVATSVADLQHLMKPPDLVLLHIGDGSHWRPDEMLNLLVSRDWATRTVLVTGQQSEISVTSLLETQRKHALKAVIPRPVDFGLIETWLSNEPQAASNEVKRTSNRWQPKNLFRSGDAPWAEYADQLEPAVVVFSTTERNKIPNIKWQNKKAKEVNDGKLTDADQRRITLLQANLAEELAKGKPARRAKCLDWDVQTNQWVECRLHPLEGSTFWYTRDWRGPKAIDEEFAHFEDERFLLSRFDRLCEYLAERWAITRVRLYQIDRLPSGLGHFPVNDDDLHRDEMPTLEMTEPLQDGESAMDWLVVPRAQSGSGWAEAEGDCQTGGAATWWSHVFRWHQFLEAAPADKPQRDQLNPSRLSNDALFEKVATGEASACATGGLATVAWGDAQARLIDVFPGLLRREVDRPDEQQPAVLSAMLAMDRRRDHLIGDLNDVLTDAKHELPRMRLAARGGRLDKPLDVHEAEAIIGGPLPEIRKRLGRWLIDDQERRVRKWHGIVSRSIQNSFSSLYGSGGMQALSALCASLMDQWPSLWQHEVERVGYLLKGEHKPILNWFFVVERNQDRMDMPAGAGSLWRLYQEEPQGMNKSSLVQRLLNDANPDWSFLVVQDYQQWRACDPAALDGAWKAYAVELAKVKTWVAIKLPSQSGFAPGLMVVHIGDTKDAAWASVLHLLVVTAQRLFPPFMLALSEQHERTAWAAAVVHEIKTDALVLQQLIKQAKDKPNQMANLMPRLLDLAHGIDNLSRDFLSTLDERFDRPVPEDSAAAWVDVGEQLNAALAPWRLRYPHIECTPDFSHLGQAPIHLDAHRLWRRVIRVLLHNAFRHGRVQVGVKAVLAGNHLQLTVRNLASADAVSQLQLTHHQQLGDLNAPFARMRVGLRNARLLCKEVGAALQAATVTAKPDGLWQVTHELRWPLASSDQIVH